MQSTNRTLGLVLGLIAVVIFGSSLPATRMAVAGGLDPWFVTAGRAAIGGTIGAVLLGLQRTRVPFDRIPTLALISACLVIGFPAAIAIASVTVPSAHGGVILGLLPLATSVGAVTLGGERPSPLFWLLTIIGALLVGAFALRDQDVEIVTGDIFLGAAVVLTGVGYTLSGVMSRSLPGWQVSAWPPVLSLPLAIIGTVATWPSDPGSVAWSAWAAVIYSGVITQFVGYAIWNQALAIGGVARIGQLQLLMPFVTFAIAAIFLGETVTATMIGFAVAVVVVVALGRRAAVRVKAS